MFNIKEMITFFRHDDKKIRDTRWIFLSMLIGAILSLIAAFVLFRVPYGGRAHRVIAWLFPVVGVTGSLALIIAMILGL